MTKFTRILLLIGILWLGFLLRLYQLDAVALRGDEAFSVQRWSAVPLSISLTDIASLEPHPPLTYVIFRSWGVIFDTQSEFSLRLLPVLFNMLGIGAVYALAKRISSNTTVGLLCAFLWAIHPFQIWHAQDFRNYGIWAGLSVVTLWLALRVIQDRNVKDWLLYTLVALSTCLIFYNELITIGVLGLYVLLMYWRDIKFTIQWSLLNGAIILITIVVFFIFQGDLVSSGEYAGTTGAFAVEQWWERFIPVLQYGDTLSLTLQQQFNPSTNWWVFILLQTTAIFGFVLISRPKRSIYPLMIALVPLLTLAIISTQLFIFRPRYIMLASPAFTIMTGYAIVLLWQRRLTQILAFALLTSTLVISAISLNNYYHNTAYDKAPDWRELINYLQNNTTSDQVIIQTGVDAGFGLYYENADILAGEFGLPTNFDQPIPDIISTMETTGTAYDTIWVVGQTFPDWQNAGVVEDWAFDNLQVIRDTRIANLPVRQFMVWDVSDDQFTNLPLAIYNDTIALRAIEITISNITDDMTVIVYWEPLAQTATPYTTFAHLVGNINPETNSPLWVQDDHLPQDGRISTNSWQVGEIYRDVYHLPLDVVINGDYQLHLGFYDPTSNQRLLLSDGSDAYITDIIEIE